MELLVLSSRNIKQPKREKAVMKAVLEAADAINVDRIVMRRGNVYSTGVYLKKGEQKSLLYNDWDKDWSWKKIYNSMMTTVSFSSSLDWQHPIILTA
jgi:hypothetical protein